MLRLRLSQAFRAAGWLCSILSRFAALLYCIERILYSRRFPVGVVVVAVAVSAAVVAAIFVLVIVIRIVVLLLLLLLLLL